MADNAERELLRGVFDDLVRFETVLWGRLDVRLREECGIGVGSFNALLVIESTEHCRVFDIAAAVEITVGGASQAVDRLEAAGQCRRVPNPSDRRSSIVELTPAGQAMLTRAGDVFDDELARLLGAPLTATALRQLGRTLATLRSAAATDSSGGP